MAIVNIPTAAIPPTDAMETMTNSPIYGDGDDDRGDFVGSEYECDVEDVTEDPNLYPSGLCYPICIGEIVAGRYRIDHKLGHGSFSTVWMAHDMTDKIDVALKIMMLGQSIEQECRIRDKIVRAVPDTGTTHLLLHRDGFLLQSPHGHHQVLVFPLQGPNLRDYSRKAPVATRMSFAVQLLQALKCLHSCGIVHGGALIRPGLLPCHLLTYDRAGMLIYPFRSKQRQSNVQPAPSRELLPTYKVWLPWAAPEDAPVYRAVEGGRASHANEAS
jgi:hypothetical protein